MAATPESSNQRVLAAVLAAGEGAVASHRTAARLWGASVGMENPIDVIVPHRGRSPVLADVMVHRPTDVRDLRPVVRDGIPCSNPLRTLVDLGAVAPWAVGPALKRRALGDRPADSVVEARLADLLAEQQLPLPTHHHVVRSGRRAFQLDYAFVERKIAIEIDGFEFHADRVRFDVDRERDALLSGLAWIVLRSTWLQSVRRPWWSPAACPICCVCVPRVRACSRRAWSRCCDQVRRERIQENGGTEGRPRDSATTGLVTAPATVLTPWARAGS